MTEERLSLAELLEKAGEGDFLRAVAETVLQLLMEADVEGLIGAGRYERSGERSTWRNGYRERTLDTRLGSLQLRIPKLRQGSYFPLSRSPQELREGAGRGDPRGLDRRCVDPPCRRSGSSDGVVWDQQVASLQAVQGDRRARACLSRPAAGRRVAVSVARCHLSEATRGRPHRLGCRDNRCGGQQRWPARNCRAAHRPVGG